MADGCGELLRLFFESFCAREKSHIFLNKRGEESTLKLFETCAGRFSLARQEERTSAQRRTSQGRKERAVQGKSRPSRD